MKASEVKPNQKYKFSGTLIDDISTTRYEDVILTVQDTLNRACEIHKNGKYFGMSPIKYFTGEFELIE